MRDDARAAQAASAAWRSQGSCQLGCGLEAIGDLRRGVLHCVCGKAWGCVAACTSGADRPRRLMTAHSAPGRGGKAVE